MEDRILVNYICIIDIDKKSNLTLGQGHKVKGQGLTEVGKELCFE